MIEPHGGRLVDRVATGDRSEHLQDRAGGQPRISLSPSQYQDARNIANGRYSPLTGFLSRNDFRKVVADMTLEDGTVWSLPIVLDVDSDTAASVTPGEYAALQGPTGETVGFIEVDDIYGYNESDVARSVFGTDDEGHPGVASLYDLGDILVGGTIELFDTDRNRETNLSPAESRVLFKKYGWETVTGFQTRNAPHRAHEYIQKSALEFVDGLFVQPKIGAKKGGDYRDEVILGAYQALIDEYYPTESVALAAFPSEMRYAGPREAVFDAIVRKNHGCTHFIVGRDHAGVGDYYDSFDPHRVFDDVSDIGITPVFFHYAFYCNACDEMTSEKTCPHDDDERVYPSGTRIRKKIQAGATPSRKVVRPEVARFILETEQPFTDK